MARFDLLAHVYDRLPIPTHPEVLAERLADLEGPRLDVGGGTGRFSVRIHAGHEPVILDASPGMLARARSSDRAVSGVRGVGQAMPFPDGTFGAATVTEAFHHFTPDQAGVVDEMARVLDPEGALLIEEIDPQRFLGRLVELGENLLMRFGSDFRTPEELTALVEPRFGEVETERTGSFTYLVEARDPQPGGS